MAGGMSAVTIYLLKKINVLAVCWALCQVLEIKGKEITFVHSSTRRWGGEIKMAIRVRQDLASQDLAVSFVSCMTLGKSLKLLVTQKPL